MLSNLGNNIEKEFLSLAFPQEVYKVVNTKKESQWAF